MEGCGARDFGDSYHKSTSSCHAEPIKWHKPCGAFCVPGPRIRAPPDIFELSFAPQNSEQFFVVFHAIIGDFILLQIPPHRTSHLCAHSGSATYEIAGKSCQGTFILSIEESVTGLRIALRTESDLKSLPDRSSCSGRSSWASGGSLFWISQSLRHHRLQHNALTSSSRGGERAIGESRGLLLSGVERGTSISHFCVGEIRIGMCAVVRRRQTRICHSLSPLQKRTPPTLFFLSCSTSGKQEG